MKKAILYTAVFLCIQVAAGLIVSGLASYFSILSDPVAGIASMVLFSAIALIVFLKLEWAEVSLSYAKSRPWMVLTWSIIAAIGSIIPSMFLQELLPQWPDMIERFTREAAMQTVEILNTKGGYFVVCLLAPVAEELVFRGAILRALLHWRPSQRWTMVTVSAIIFALVHLNPDQMPHALLAGLLLGWMYMRTDSILPGIAFHWANNTITYVFTRLYPDLDMTLVQLFGSQPRTLMAVGFSLLILLPALYQLNLWMKARK